MIGPQEFKIPEPLRIDQNDLCAALERAILSSGKTGKAAKKLLKVLQPHLLKEEGDLLQTLGLLVPLAQGKISAEMRSVPLKTEHLKSRMFGIMREHITKQQFYPQMRLNVNERVRTGAAT